MSSNTPYGTEPFKRNSRLTAAHLETLRNASAGNIQLRNPDNFVKRLPGGHILTSKQRGKSGGAQRPYLKIKTVIDRNNYTADVITPTSAAVLKAGVTVKALQPDAGAALKVDLELFADIVDDVYYIQPSVFYGD
jgi:hypothetical protein